MKRLIIILLFIAFGTFLMADSAGEILYIEGDVGIKRNGESLSEDLICIGEPIENFDFISTGPDGLAEPCIVSPNGQESTIRVSTNSSFYIELGEVSGGDVTTIDMVSGTLALNVNKIAGNNQVEVKTESAAMGVRGTKFTVVTSTTGDTLVTCEEGNVSCKDNSGKEYYAKPGKVVQKNEGESINQQDVSVEDLKGFRESWFNKRLEVFKANPLKAIKNYAIRYNKLTDELDTEFFKLISKKDTLNKWFEEDKRGQIGSKIEITKEKPKIIQSLFKLKRIIFMLEKMHYRLKELHKYFKEGYGEGEIKPGLTSAKFFKNFREKAIETEKKLLKIRYIMKLYAKRNGGYFPMESSIMGGGGDGDFF